MNINVQKHWSKGVYSDQVFGRFTRQTEDFAWADVTEDEEIRLNWWELVLSADILYVARVARARAHGLRGQTTNSCNLRCIWTSGVSFIQQQTNPHPNSKKKLILPEKPDRKSYSESLNQDECRCLDSGMNDIGLSPASKSFVTTDRRRLFFY